MAYPSLYGLLHRNIFTLTGLSTDIYNNNNNSVYEQQKVVWCRLRRTRTAQIDRSKNKVVEKDLAVESNLYHEIAEIARLASIVHIWLSFVV